MSDLTDEELQEACAIHDRLHALNQIAYVMPEALAAAGLLQSAALEVKRHRAAVRADRERVRAVVLEAGRAEGVGVFMASHRMSNIADRAAERLAGAVELEWPSVGAQVSLIGGVHVGTITGTQSGPLPWLVTWPAGNVVGHRASEIVPAQPPSESGQPRRASCPDLDPNYPGPDGKPRGPVLCVSYPNCRCGKEDGKTSARGVVLSDDELAHLRRIRFELEGRELDALRSMEGTTAETCAAEGAVLDKLIAAHRKAP